MLSRKALTLITLCCCLFMASDINAKWFLLPGLYYTDENGIIGQIVLITENDRGDRVETGLQYFGGEEGKVFLRLFIPRTPLEWRLEGRYQISEADAYSSQYASNHDLALVDLRYWTELLVGCDYIQDDGLFYGIKGRFKNVQFKNDVGGDISLLADQSAFKTYTEGQEYSTALRFGLERRDNRHHSRNGTYILWQVGVGQSTMATRQIPFMRTELDLREYLPLGSLNSVLAFNIRGGIVTSNIPYFSRFNMGGSNSLRGVPIDRYNGSTYYLGRAEYRRIVFENVPSPFKMLKFLDSAIKDYKISYGFTLFTDLGDMWRGDHGWWGFRQNIGFGLRMIMPPNVVASIDVATPLDSDYIAIYFNLAQSF